MYIIAHRGNISGPDKRENHPDYIMQAVKKGFNVEIDVWYNNGKYFLGHDMPQYEIPVQFLKNKFLWCHAKNILALSDMINHRDIHCFWHQEDSVTLTSKNYIWTYPGQELTDKSICVMPEKISKIDYKEVAKCKGICSDYISSYRNIL